MRTQVSFQGHAIKDNQALKKQGTISEDQDKEGTVKNDLCRPQKLDLLDLVLGILAMFKKIKGKLGNTSGV